MKLRTLAVCSLLLFAACGTLPKLHDYTKIQYLNEGFDSTALQRGGLALLPITAGQGQEGYRRPLGDYLNADLQAAAAGGRVLTWQEAMSALNAHSTVAAYAAALDTYRSTSIIDRQSVRVLSSALDVRYALYCSLQEFSRIMGVATVRAHFLVLDLESGDVVEEIVGHTESDPILNLFYEDHARALSTSVLSRLPGSTVKRESGATRLKATAPSSRGIE